MARKRKPDFEVCNHGSIVTFLPLTKRSRAWLNENCAAEPWQWFGGALNVEPRCAPDIYDGMVDAGFVTG